MGTEHRWSGSQSSDRWKKRNAWRSPKNVCVGGYGLVTIKRVSSHMFCPSLATKWRNEVIRINVSHFLLSAGERPQIMVWNSVNTFHWVLMLQNLLIEKSDSLNINQMDVVFVDLCSFMSVNETLYSRKKRIAICYWRNRNRATVEGLLLVISLKINGREEHQRAV